MSENKRPDSTFPANYSEPTPGYGDISYNENVVLDNKSPKKGNIAPFARFGAPGTFTITTREGKTLSQAETDKVLRTPRTVGGPEIKSRAQQLFEEEQEKLRREQEKVEYLRHLVLLSNKAGEVRARRDNLIQEEEFLKFDKKVQEEKTLLLGKMIDTLSQAVDVQLNAETTEGSQDILDHIESSIEHVGIVLDALEDLINERKHDAKIEKEGLSRKDGEQYEKLKKLQPQIFRYAKLEERIANLIAKTSNKPGFLQDLLDIDGTVVWLKNPGQQLNSTTPESVKKTLDTLEVVITNKEKELEGQESGTAKQGNTANFKELLRLSKTFAQLQKEVELSDQGDTFKQIQNELQKIEDTLSERPTQDLFEEFKSKLAQYEEKVRKVITAPNVGRSAFSAASPLKETAGPGELSDLEKITANVAAHKEQHKDDRENNAWQRPENIRANNISFDKKAEQWKMNKNGKWEPMTEAELKSWGPILATLQNYREFMSNGIVARNFPGLIHTKNEILEALNANNFGLADQKARELGPDVREAERIQKEIREHNLAKLKKEQLVTDETTDFAFVQTNWKGSLVIDRNTGDLVPLTEKDVDYVARARSAVGSVSRFEKKSPLLFAKKNEIIRLVNAYNFKEAADKADALSAYMYALTIDKHNYLPDIIKEKKDDPGITKEELKRTSSEIIKKYEAAATPEERGEVVKSVPAPTAAISPTTSVSEPSPAPEPKPAPLVAILEDAKKQLEEKPLRLMDSWPADIVLRKTPGDKNKGTKEKMEWVKRADSTGKETILNFGKWSSLKENFDDIFNDYKNFFKKGTTVEGFQSAGVEKQRKTVECRDLIDLKNELVDALTTLDENKAETLIDFLRAKIVETNEIWDAKMKKEVEENAKDKKKEGEQKEITKAFEEHSKALAAQIVAKDEIFPLLTSELEKQMFEREVAAIITTKLKLQEKITNKETLTWEEVVKYRGLTDTFANNLVEKKKRLSKIYGDGALSEAIKSAPHEGQKFHLRDGRTLDLTEWREEERKRMEAQKEKEKNRVSSGTLGVIQKHMEMLARDPSGYVDVYAHKEWPKDTTAINDINRGTSEEVLAQYAQDLEEERDNLVASKAIFEAQLHDEDRDPSEKPTQEQLDRLSEKIDEFNQGITLIKDPRAKNILRAQRAALLTKSLKKLKQTWSPAMTPSIADIGYTKDTTPNKKLFKLAQKNRLRTADDKKLDKLTPDQVAGFDETIGSSTLDKNNTNPNHIEGMTVSLTEDEAKGVKGSFNVPTQATPNIAPEPESPAPVAPSNPIRPERVDPTFDGNIPNPPSAPVAEAPSPVRNQERVAEVNKLFSTIVTTLEKKGIRDWKAYAAATLFVAGAAGTAAMLSGKKTGEATHRPSTALEAVTKSYEKGLAEAGLTDFANDLVKPGVGVLEFIKLHTPELHIEKNTSRLSDIPKMQRAQLFGTPGAYGLSEDEQTAVCDLISKLEKSITISKTPYLPQETIQLIFNLAQEARKKTVKENKLS